MRRNSTVKPHITQLRHLLRNNADPQTKSWWESYVKESAPFLGVKMPVIRSLVHAWHTGFVADTLAGEAQRKLALALVRQPHTEEKLAGMILLQEILLPAGLVRCPGEVDRIADLFASGAIYDWNACDWFCVKVLGPLIEGEGPSCAERIAAWRTADNLWQARASLVAFVKVADQRAYYPLVEESCRVLIRREERFAKTGLGWILRDISKHDEAFVRRVIEENIEHFSRESLRNATKYFSQDERGAAIQMLKRAQVGVRRNP